jgi:molybdopterin adenylyltransferase
MRVAVITVSDTVAEGTREDVSGAAVVAHCRGLGWEVISSLHSSDDPANIREQLRKLADSGRVDLIFTSGGTGLGPRDNTPESTEAVADIRIPGIAEEMRRIGAQSTPTALLSRAVAVVRHKTLIVNLPGSPKGAVESLAAIAHLLPHAIHVIHGARHD